MTPNSAESYSIKIEPSGPLGGVLRSPPSKNYTTRFILAAALAEGQSLIRGTATNDDAKALIRCLRSMGAGIEEEAGGLRVSGFAGRPKNPGVLNPGNAGAVLRMLLGIACLTEGEVRFETDHAESLGRRPNHELLDALRALGAETRGKGAEETLPISVSGRQIHGGKITVDASRSSQFLSSLLFLAPHLKEESLIEVAASNAGPALVSRPLVDQTLETLRRFGAEIDATEDRMNFRIKGGQRLAAGNHEVNGDWPSSAALMASVAVAGGMAGFTGLFQDAQGERRAKDALMAMGCEFMEEKPGEVFIHSVGRLRAINFDGDLATDAVLAIEAAACLVEGTTRIDGVGNLKIKESDRLREPLEELAKIGVAGRHGADWIEITGRPEGYDGGIEVDCRGDHRIAQMLAIVGMRCVHGLTLTGAECVSKSYPDFFSDLKRLGVKLHCLAPTATRI